MKRATTLTVVWLLAAAALRCAAEGTHHDSVGRHAPTAQQEFFEARVRPVLVEHCYECHSSAAAVAEGNLLLDSRDGVLKGGDSGAAIVAGEPDQSLLLQALRHDTMEMPPAGKLPDNVIDDFEQWIRSGAVDPRDEPPSAAQAAEAAWKAKLAERRTWWSLQPPQRSALPEVNDAAWAKEPLDRFILAKLHDVGLSPAPPADPDTLARRLCFVLTGLPPAPEQVQEFRRAWARDNDAAVVDIVDRLLVSPHFGERFARNWMDVVRYTDTYGYEWDNPAKGSWEYRDYLIRALNRDIGFDDLIREQIAGDLLDIPRIDPASGINESLIGPMFYHMGEHRHGSSLDFNGVHQEMIDNKIDALSKTFLGMTVACARCHDHKLDAVSQADYYALAGVLMTPRWTVRDIDSEDKDAAAIAELKQLRQGIHDALAAAWTGPAVKASLEAAALQQWAVQHRAAFAGAVLEEIAYPLRQLLDVVLWLPAEEITAAAESPSTELVIDSSGAILASGEVPPTDSYTVQFTTGPGSASQLRLEALPHETLGSGGPGCTPHGNFVLTHIQIEVTPNPDPDSADDPSSPASQRVSIASAAADFSQAGYPVAAALDPSPQTGWGIGGVTPLNVARTAQFVFSKPVDLAHGARWTVTLVQHYGSQHQLGRFRIAVGDSAVAPRSGEGRLALDRELTDHWQRLAGQWLQERQARQDSNNATFKSVSDFATPGFPSDWAVEGRGIEHGYVEDGAVLIDLHSESLIAKLLPPGYHTHALSSKLAGAIRLPRPENLPGKFVSLRMAGGEWAGRIDVPQNAFQAEEVSFFDPAAASTWQAVTPRAMSNGVTRVLTEFATASLHPNFPPRTGVARAGATRLPDDDNGHDKRSWFSVTEIIAHESAGAPADTLDPFALLYQAPLPGSREESWQRLSQWFAGCIERWAAGQTQPGDVRVLNWLLKQKLLLNDAASLPQVAMLVERYREIESRLEFARSVMSMDERGVEPVNYRLNVRGNVDEEGPAIDRNFLDVFASQHRVGHAANSGRRELAEYLASRDNPQTARVYVNRVWQWIFGTGLVSTPNDFGRLGDRPSHEELLDALAIEFMEDGWSTKRLIRRLVLSRTFAQAGLVDPFAAARDPANRLLHHYPTRRLEAEAIRDSLLMVSGRLDRRLYGPGVNPPRSAEDAAKRLYSGPWDSAGKRSLYVTLSIMEPPKFLAGFNLPDLKLPTGRRDQTNVPGQALILLNDPLVTQLADQWAQRLINEDHSTDERIVAMFMAALGREPTEQEHQRWLSAAHAFASPQTDPRSNQQMWAEVAHVLFNLKEFIYYR
jgi:hypothetical protein